MDWAGNFVAVWTDNRNVHNDVWMQRFDSDGNPIGANQKVNDDLGTDDQSGSQMAMDKDGNFVVVWHDNRDGNYNIYVQRFDSSGNPVGFNFKINDDASVARQLRPSIGMDSNGNFVVTWIDGRDGGQDIYAQRFDNAAIPVGANFCVNESRYAIMGSHWHPGMNVSMSDAGLFGVTWTTDADYDEQSQLCVRFFHWATGESIAPTSVVTGDVSHTPKIGMDDAGRSTIIWYHSGAVMARRYNLSGNPVTSAYVIDDASWYAVPSMIAVRPSGEFVVCFWVGSNNIRYTRVRRFDASGNPIGASFQVDTEEAWAGSIAITSAGQFVVGYCRKSITGDLYSQRFDWSGTPLGDSILLNDDGNYLSQAMPKIAVATPEKFMVVWADARDKDTDSNIYGRIFQISGDSAVPVGKDFRIPGDGAPWKSWGYPDIGGSDGGHFVVVWPEYHLGALSDPYWMPISIRVYDVLGTLIVSNRHTPEFEPRNPSVAINRSRSFVVATKDLLGYLGEGSEYDIFLTYFNPDATVIRDIRVNPSDDNGASQSNPQVAMNDNTVLVAWNDPIEGRDDVWARLYSFPDGSPLTDEFRVHEDISQTGHYLAGVAIDDDGRFIITWNDRREGDWDIYARRFHYDAPFFTPMGPEFKVNDDELAGVEQKGGDAVMTSSENGDFAITWYDWRDGDPDVYIRLYGGDGEPKAASFRIGALHDSQQLIPAVTGTEDNIIAAWLDDRGGDWDVYARLKSWETLSVAVSISPESLEVKPCENANFTVTVENDGAEIDSYTLDMTEIPDDFVWEMETSITDLPPGEFVELPLTISRAYEQGICEDEPYSFSVTVTSVTNPDISDTADGEFTIEPAPCEPGESENQLTLNLDEGINIVSIPFKTDWRLSDLIRHIGEDDVSMIVYYHHEWKKFVAYMLSFGDDAKLNAPVQCGEGYIVVMKAAKQVVFEGYSCEDESIFVAPQMPMILSKGDQNTSVFVVTGYVMDETGTTRDGVCVTARNLGTGQTLQNTTGTLADSGRYVITAVISSRDMMTSAGDQLEITAIDETHRLTMPPITYTLTDAELSSSALYMPPLRLRSIPEHSALLPNYPNPFNPETWLPYQLNTDAAVTISIYNQKGQLVRDIAMGYQAAGLYINRDKAAYWDGRNEVGEKVASGVYFYKLRAGRFAATRRMLIVK